MTFRHSIVSNTPFSSNSFAAHRDCPIHRRLWKSTCFIRDLKGDDLLTGSRGTDLYSITLHDTNSPNPICLMAKATSSQAWLWHRRLSHLNFDTINLLSKNDIVVGLPKLKFIKDHLCSSYELGKAKRKSFHSKLTSSSKRRLQLLHMDLCGPMRVANINGKGYVLVIVDDYSRYTWTHFLRSKDETPEVLIDFLRLVQRGLQAQVRVIRTDKGTWNRTLVEVARTMLSAAKVPLFFWAEAIATASFTQNRSLVIPRHEKTPYHIINDKKPSVKFFYIFGFVCYIVRDGENLYKMKEKGASVSVMPLFTYLNLGLGELAHTKLTIVLADMTVRYPKGIAKNVLVRIGKFIFLVDFVILDMPKDIKVPLILERPFLSMAHAKIDVYKRKITLRVREEKVVFKSVKPASSLIKRVYMLSLREIIELDLKSRLMGETLVLNRSLDPFFEDYIKLNDLNEPIEIRRNQGDDLIPTIEEDKMVYKRNNVVGALTNVPIFVKTFSVVMDFAILENMDAYRDEGMDDVIVG
nr:retrovirus-related Pol polyprotein from transposon TNT 1-94 [Tanacetum cinerariifolium]